MNSTDKRLIDKYKDVKNLKEILLQDPILSVLINNCNLTKKQFETFVIDVFSDNVIQNGTSYDEKTFLRSIKVSRGSFYRTLTQARKNIISSIFTMILLNYLGILSEDPFEDFRVISERLKDYAELMKESDLEQKKKLAIEIERELIDGIVRLSDPRSLK